MSAGWENLTENARLLKEATEATVEAHPEWLTEKIEALKKEDEGIAARRAELGLKLQEVTDEERAARARESLQAGVLMAAFMGQRDEEGGLTGITRTDGWRAKLKDWTKGDVKLAISELSIGSQKWKPARCAEVDLGRDYYMYTQKAGSDS
ncbi:hypothetical protein FWC63_02905 [Candidatus Saccharibacteria bacterium]|nr:hypothetical protein [Candidatus Saccharibacteria bacterium]